MAKRKSALPVPKSRGRRSVLLLQAWWQERMLRGVAEYAATHNWELQFRMHWTHRPPPRDGWKGDGIIAFIGVSRWLRKASGPIITFVRGANVPVVETQAFENFFGAPQVIPAHAEVGRMAAEHFLRLNFQHLAYVTFDENPLEASRREAFRQSVEKARRQFHALTPRTLERNLAELPRPMAIFAMNDVNAIEVMRVCLDAGAKIPEEFAVLGADDTEIVCNLAAVPLSSINLDFERQGYEAAAVLDRLMDGERKKLEPLIIAPRGVTVRRSTDTVAIPDPEAARLLRFLRDHYRENRSIQQIADDLSVSQRRIHDIFTQHVGRTMHQELTRLRVEHAKRLIPNLRLKLETVGVESGFSNRFHFFQAFKRLTGQTPREYRRLILQAKKLDGRTDYP